MKNKLLKGLIVSGLLLTSSAFADVYIGADYGQVSNTDSYSWTGTGSLADQDNKYSDVDFHIGAGTDGEWKIQLRFSSISFDKRPLNAYLGLQHVLIDDKLKEIGFDILKEFTITKDVYPFVKVGVGYGWTNITGTTDSTIHAVSANAGVGLSYKAIEHLYLVAGIDYIARRWQDIKNSGGYTLTTTGSGAKLYAGVNYAF